MSRMSELSYDIQELYIDGMTAKTIAATLDCNIEIVLGVLESFGCEDAEEFNPYDTINS